MRPGGDAEAAGEEDQAQDHARGQAIDEGAEVRRLAAGQEMRGAEERAAERQRQRAGDEGAQFPDFLRQVEYRAEDGEPEERLLVESRAGRDNELEREVLPGAARSRRISVRR